MMRTSPAPMLALCIVLSACSSLGNRKSAWDHYDYGTRTPSDNDSDYSLPAISCVDDAPNC